MHGTHLRNAVIWSTAAVAVLGGVLAAAGWEEVGFGVWLGAVTVQCTVGITGLLDRRRARAR